MKWKSSLIISLFLTCTIHLIKMREKNDAKNEDEHEKTWKNEFDF